MPHEPESIIFDPNYAYGIIAGVVAYLLAVPEEHPYCRHYGCDSADIAQGIENIIRGIPAPIRLGAAGAVDAVLYLAYWQFCWRKL